MESLARSRVQGFPQHLSSIRGAESFDKKLAAYESANHLRHLEWFGKVRLKPMQISTSTRYALSACVAVAILAGCNSTASVTPAQGTGLAPNGTGVVQSVAPGFTDLRRCRSGCRRKIEGLTSTSGSARSGSTCFIEISASGNTVGPYRGTFTGGGGFWISNWPCNKRYGFGGNFVITSGANTISGSYSGSGIGGCGRAGCGAGGNLTYKATIEPGGKTFSGKGYGSLRDAPWGASMALTLRSM